MKDTQRRQWVKILRAEFGENDQITRIGEKREVHLGDLHHLEAGFPKQPGIVGNFLFTDVAALK